MIRAVAAYVDDVRAAVRREGEDVVVGALLNNTLGVVRAGKRIVNVVVDRDVVVLQFLRSRNVVAEIVVLIADVRRDNRNVVFQIRRADVFALAPLRNGRAIRRAHNGTPRRIAAIFLAQVFVVFVTVVVQTKGVTDFVRNRFRNILAA